MFCPKCGTQNLETGRFCRQCGADLGNIPDALSGNLQKTPLPLLDRKGKPINWESAIVKIFSGLAFITVAIILGLTGVAGGREWWFWMLIPGFGALGSGIAQIVQLKTSRNTNASFIPANAQNVFNPANQNAGLPPSPANVDEIRDLVNSGNKITAIKVYRETYGVGLKEAKDAVESMERGQIPIENGCVEQPPRGSIYDTGELSAPPSVTENTTKHLQIDKEGETMTLPKSNL